MKLYTKRGDDGMTDLFGGSRVSKSDLLIAACGDVDETNAAIGVVIAACDDEETVTALLRIQQDLFVLGGALATPEGTSKAETMGEGHVTQLERWIDEASAEVAPLKQFVLPGGAEAATRLHLARTICRRAERAVVALADREASSRWTRIYLNRLSDLLFALARRVNHRAGVAETEWVPSKHRG